MRKSVLVGAILLAMMLVIIAPFYLVNKSSESTNPGQSIVIWAPLLVLFIVNRNKARNQNLTNNQKLIVVGVLVLTVLLVVLTLLF